MDKQLISEVRKVKKKSDRAVAWYVVGFVIIFALFSSINDLHSDGVALFFLAWIVGSFIAGHVLSDRAKKEREDLEKRYPGYIFDFGKGTAVPKPGYAPPKKSAPSDGRTIGQAAAAKDPEGMHKLRSQAAMAQQAYMKNRNAGAKSSGADAAPFRGVSLSRGTRDLIGDRFVTLLQRDNMRPQAQFAAVLFDLDGPTVEGYEAASWVVDVRNGMAYIQDVRRRPDEALEYYYTPVEYEQIAQAAGKEEKNARFTGITEDNWKEYLPEDEIEKRLRPEVQGRIQLSPSDIMSGADIPVDALYIAVRRTDGGGVCFLRHTSSGWRLFTALSASYEAPEIPPALCSEQSLLEMLRAERYVGIADLRDRLLDPVEERYLTALLVHAFPAGKVGNRFAVSEEQPCAVTVLAGCWTGTIARPAADIPEIRSLYNELTMLCIRGGVMR